MMQMDVRAHLLQLLRQLDEVFRRYAPGWWYSSWPLRDAAVFLGGLHGRFQIARIVERVEDTDDIDAVFNGLSHEGIHHVVRIMLIAQDVLPAQQHLQLGVGDGLAQGAQALPRILVQKAQAGVKRRAAPALPGNSSRRCPALATGSISSVRIRVAACDWCASRRMVS